MKKTNSISFPVAAGLRAIVWAGLIAGILDLAFAAVSTLLHGGEVTRMLKAIAGGAYGRGAVNGGPGIAALGLVFHFCISFGAALVYYIASRIFPFINRHAVIYGLAYGLAVYLFMNMVVLPLSAYHKPVTMPSLLSPDVLSHLFFVGLVIALIVKRYSEERG